jgi:hypothetical protein
VLCSAPVKKKKNRPPKPVREKRTKKYAGPKSEGETSSGGGGVLQSMVRGMKTVAGTQNPEKQKESLFSKLFWWVLLLAAAAFAAYQLTK